VERAAVKAYLTRRRNGLFLLTHDPPVLAHVGKLQKKDAYPRPGDLLAFNNICVFAAEALWRAGEMEELSTCRVTFCGEKLSEPFSAERFT
jgi:hypothetical protein